MLGLSGCTAAVHSTSMMGRMCSAARKAPEEAIWAQGEQRNAAPTAGPPPTGGVGGGTARVRAALKEGDGVAGAREVGRGQGAGRPAADHGDGARRARAVGAVAGLRLPQPRLHGDTLPQTRFLRLSTVNGEPPVGNVTDSIRAALSQ